MKPSGATPFSEGLRKTRRGNTLAIMAAAFFPLAGLIGGGVDMSRIYITKTRLQQACDAGALAGRKAMGAGSWTTSGSEQFARRGLRVVRGELSVGRLRDRGR